MSRRVLIVDATATNRIALKAILSGARYDSAAVATGREALDAIRDQTPDAILVDAVLPDMEIHRFCALVSAQLGDAMPPVIVMLEPDAGKLRLEAIKSGAAALLSRPVERSWLLTNLRALLRSHETRSELRRRNVTAANLGFADAGAGFGAAARIALVAEDGARGAALARVLRQQTFHRIETLTTEEALAASDDPARAPELFLLCLDQDVDDTFTLMAELRARRDTRRAVIMVEYDPAERSTGARALDQGASDLIRSDASVEECALRIDRQLRLKRQDDVLRASVDASLQMAAHDPLTGLFNRRYAMRYLEDLATQVENSDRGFGLLLLDIDHFKAVNDSHGHAAGDTILKQVAERLKDNLREGDLLARIGGEEFLVALPDCANDEAYIAAERLRTAIAAEPFQLRDGTTLRVTISAGSICGSGAPDELLSRADGALYRAKEAGRDRVERAASCGTSKASRRHGDMTMADRTSPKPQNARFLS